MLNIETGYFPLCYDNQEQTLKLRYDDAKDLLFWLDPFTYQQK